MEDFKFCWEKSISCYFRGELTEECMRALLKCKSSVYRDLFSLNEEFEDISTANIKYLSLEYYLARLLGGLKFTNFQERISILEQCHLLHDNFIQLVTSYLDRDLPVFESIPSDRQRKINQTMTMRLLKSELPSNFNDLIIGADSNLFANVDEEDLRKWLKINLKVNYIESQIELEMIKEEKKMLVSRMKGDDDPVNHSNPELLPKPQFSKNTFKITRPIKFIPSSMGREDLQKKVFMERRNLPTMTIDQFLELERSRGAILQETTKSSEIPQEFLSNEQQEHLLEQKRQKDISFDAFKDITTKGSGNTFNLS